MVLLCGLVGGGRWGIQLQFTQQFENMQVWSWLVAPSLGLSEVCFDWKWKKMNKVLHRLSIFRRLKSWPLRSNSHTPPRFGLLKYHYVTQPSSAVSSCLCDCNHTASSILWHRWCFIWSSVQGLAKAPWCWVWSETGGSPPPRALIPDVVLEQLSQQTVLSGVFDCSGVNASVSVGAGSSLCALRKWNICFECFWRG